MEATSFGWLWLLMINTAVVFVCKIWFHYWWIPRRIENHFLLQGIKGPNYHFFLGNLKELASLSSMAASQPMTSPHNILPRVLSFYHHWRKLHGATFLLWFGHTARLTIADPILIKDIFLTKSEYFEKNEAPPLVKKLEGDGLLSLKGEKWAHHRKVITPTFHLENLKLMMPMMGESMGKMLKKWSKMSSNDGGKVEIEVSEWFQNLAQDVITRTAFGSSYEDGRTIYQLQAQQMIYATEAYQKAFIPGYRFLPTEKNRISWRLDKEIRKSLMKLIENRKKNRTGTTGTLSEPNDLLEVMIKATCFKETATNTDIISNISSAFMMPPSSSITVHDIVEECKTISFAGKHTTANLLTWTTILLAMHPQWQELAREEVLTVCGARDTPTKDHISKLKTIGMIINECLRLYPPAVAAIRRAKVNVQLGDLSIPKGTELLIPIVAVHHDPELWGPDVNEFNPVRFAKGVGHAARHSMAFMPFGLGSRRCIGQNLATLQAKLAIAMILQSFSFDLSPSYQHAPTVQMLLQPQYGAPLIFQKL